MNAKIQIEKTNTYIIIMQHTDNKYYTSIFVLVKRLIVYLFYEKIKNL